MVRTKEGKSMNIKGKMREKSGITLITLAVTIIVLLILAGVSIVTLTGENGILTQANNAKEETENAQIIEKLEIAILEDQMGNKNEDVNIEKKQGYYILTYNDKKYLYAENEGITEYDNTLAYYIENNELGIGDYMEYLVGSGLNTQNGNYTITSQQTGYDYNQTFDVTTYDGKWQILYNGSEGYGVQIISRENILKNEEQNVLVIQRKKRV